MVTNMNTARAHQKKNTRLNKTKRKIVQLAKRQKAEKVLVEEGRTGCMTPRGLVGFYGAIKNGISTLKQEFNFLVFKSKF